MLRFGVISFILCLAVTYVSSQIVIDDFNNPVMAVANLTVQTITLDTMGAGILDGTRRITARLISAPDDQSRVVCVVSDRGEGSFILAADTTTTGNCMLDYPLDMPTDLINGPACDCWLTRATLSDAETRVSFTAVTQTGTFSSNVVIPDTLFGFNPLDLCLPFDRANIQAYSQTNSIRVLALPLRLAGDIQLTYTCCAPSVSCWHSVNANTPAVAGETISISFSCENYVSIPATAENIEATFPFPQSIGTIQAPSVSCTNGNPILLNNAVELTIQLAESENFTCTFDVLLENAGDTGNLAGSVENLQAGTTLRTGLGGNRAGTRAFCDPPVSNALQVISAPTTLPPTTLPPTTLPPTTAPPTTSPPTTLPPTTLPPTTLPPTTLPPTTLPPTTLPPTTLPPTTLPPTTLPPTTAPPTTLPPTTLPPVTAPPTTLPPTTLPPTTLPPTTLPPTTMPPTRPCPPFTTSPIATECYRLRNHPGAIERPPEYCLRLDALVPNAVVTFDCDTGNGLYIRVDPVQDTLRIFGNITGGIDTGFETPNPVSLDVDITYSGLNIMGTDPNNVTIQIEEESIGFLRFDGEEYVIMGKQSEDTGYSLGVIRPHLGVVDIFSLFGWVRIARPGGPFNTEFVNDWQGTIGECILCEDIDLGGSGQPVQPPPTPVATDAPTDAPTTDAPTDAPTDTPTDAPTEAPTAATNAPTDAPTAATDAPTVAPTAIPTAATDAPTDAPVASQACPLSPENCPTGCNQVCPQCFVSCQCGNCNFGDAGCMVIPALEMVLDVQVPPSGCLVLELGAMVAGSITGTSGNDCVLLGVGAAVFGDINLGEGNDCIRTNTANVDGEINTGSGDDCVELDQSQVQGIDLGDGMNCLNSGNSAAQDISTGDQSDCVLLSQGGTYEDIETGAGNDIVIATTSITTFAVDLSDGDDCFEYSLSSARGSLDLGSGMDNVIVNEGIVGDINAGTGRSCMRITASSTTDTITGSSDTDNIFISESTVQGPVNLGAGNDFLFVEGSAQFRSAIDGGADGGAGVDSLIVTDAFVSSISGGADNDCLYSEDNFNPAGGLVSVDGSAGNDVCSSDNMGEFTSCETTATL